MHPCEILTGMPIPEYAGNPFIERLPPITSISEVQRSFDRPPLLTEQDRRRPPEERLHIVMRLLRYSQPTVTAREVGRKVELMIRQGYVGRNPLTSDWVRMVQACGMREAAEKASKGQGSVASPVEVLGDLTPVSDTSMSTLVVGPPGMGKTHAVETALSRFKQVIYHEKPFALAQIVWLRLECPPNGSLVGLCTFFFEAVDKALRSAGVQSDLAQQYKRANLATMLTGMARVANLHAIGLLVIDEIQHVKVAHSEGGSLLNFLVTLRNSIGIPLMMIGTMSAMSVVQRTFRDARRADGLGSTLFNRMEPALVAIRSETTSAGEVPQADAAEGPRPVYGPEFEGFVKRMWRWQYTNFVTPLTTELLNALYDETQGVTDLLVKLFVLIQMRLIEASGAAKSNEEVITPELVHEVAASSFHVVRPFLKALRENDQKALLKHEDLVDFSAWFEAHLQNVGLAELEPQRDEDHGDPSMPPMVTEGAIDRALLDSLLQGFLIEPKDRARYLARHSDKVEAGDVSGLVDALRTEMLAAGTRAEGRKRRAHVPPVDGDLRKLAEGATDAAEVAERLGLASLDEALAE